MSADGAFLSSQARSVLRILRSEPTQTETYQVSELQQVLRSRLILVCMIFVIPLIFSLAATIYLALRNPDDPVVDFPTHFLVLGLLLAALALLVKPRPPTLSELRTLEIYLFGCVTAFLVRGQNHWYDSGWLAGIAQPGQEGKMMQMAGDSMSCPWFMLIVLYGTSIPNSGRRCALMVGTMSAIALLFTLFLSMQNDTLGPFVRGEVMDKMSFWLAIGSAIAIYGSHKINVLHQQALEARKLGQYRLTRRLGAGGMGEVFLAEHQLLRRSCAVKLIRPEQAGDRASLQRFEREVRAMATLNHPNAVDIFDYGHAEDGTFYYAMEYLPGLNLEQLGQEYAPLPPERVVHLLGQICGALSEAHAIGLVHRDIKPSNFIVCERGGVYDLVKLLDYGLVSLAAREAGQPLREGNIVGTPLYMSPEQAMGSDRVDARSDIYSLGAVAYFLLSGRAVFVHHSALEILEAHRREPVVPLSDLRPEFPLDLQAVILRCLEKDPDDRFASAEELRQALDRCRCSGRWSQPQAADWWRANHRAEMKSVPDVPTAAAL